MDDNSNQVRRCGQIGEGQDDEVSMQDVLDEQARLQADASAVLGASDPHNCTYPKGYLKRQALYACKTCTPNGNAGICLACSYACHEGHDLYELYTKRFFCCDCGNDKFAGKECKLAKDKQLNSCNRYNQNYKGLYCTCSRPYPDPEDAVEDEMIQCIICEDWHHGRHLNIPVPDDFSEMTCPDCMSRFPFLWAYHVSSEGNVVKKEECLNESNHLDVGTSGSPSVDKTKSSPQEDKKPTIAPVVKQDSPSVSDKENSLTEDVKLNDSMEEKCEDAVNSSPSGVKRKRDNCDEEGSAKSKVSKTSGDEEDIGASNEESCLLQSLQKRDYDVFEHAVFWSEDWRSKLCKCDDCMEMYKDKGVGFLPDETDTVSAYEQSGPPDEPQEEESEENLFAGMHRVQQIEIARGVRDLKTGLNEFLQGFASEGKVVTETDIREFFQSMEEKRRRRMNPPQDNCR